MTPAANPMARLAAGLTINPALAPIATPPAKVALRISSIPNFFLPIEVVMNVPMQLPVKAITVFTVIICLSKLFTGKNPALKEGQKRKRKKVPIKEKVMEVCEMVIALVGLIL